MRTLVMLAALFMPFLSAGSAPCVAPDGKEDVITIRDEGDRGGWLGVSAGDAGSSGTRGSAVREGALVNRVLNNSPAEKAGVREGDVIVEINGHSIADRWELLKEVREAKPGSRASIVVMRGSKRETLSATLGKEPEAFGHIPRIPLPPHEFHFPAPWVPPHALHRADLESYGLSLMEMNEQLAAYFEAPNNTGVLVEEVEEDSPAEKSGFKAGDVIITLGKDTVRDEHEVWEALDRFKKGEEAIVGIIRKGVRQTLSLAVIEREPGTSFRHRHRMPHWRYGPDFPWDSGKLDRRLKELGQRLGKMGRELGEQMKGLGMRIKAELRVIEV